MSPWTLLGWILLVLVVGYLLIRLTIILVAACAAAIPVFKTNRKYKRAIKGKVTCEFFEWVNEPLPGEEDKPYYQRKTERVKTICSRPATHSARKYGSTRGYWCEEHAAKQRGTGVYPQPLNRPEPTHKTKVIS